MLSGVYAPGMIWAVTTFAIGLWAGIVTLMEWDRF